MYYLQAEQSFDAAHFLKDYPGKCHNIHGHRWRVLAKIQGAALQPSGGQKDMLVDFGDLKTDLKTLVDTFDHCLILEEGSLKPATLSALQEEDFKLVTVPFRTTAENFSRFFFEALGHKGYNVAEVSVYETPTNCAVYTGKEGAHVTLL